MNEVDDVVLCKDLQGYLVCDLINGNTVMSESIIIYLQMHNSIRVIEQDFLYKCDWI